MTIVHTVYMALISQRSK